MTMTTEGSLLPQTQIRPGDVLAGKYRVDRLIGVGGMGVVVQATHLELETQVAIKFLLPEAQTNAELVARFTREARAAVQIRSEHVARTFDVGRLENGCPYIVMEYLEGSDLSRRIAENGPLPMADAVRFTLHACDALSEAHALGIVHRDLKPANIFLSRRRDGVEVGKILDFGISKLTQGSSTGPGMTMTRTSTLMGSPVYMSPEQLVAAKNVDPRADIWALGVTLYEALCGVTPFQGDTLPELCTRIMTQPPTPIALNRGDIPEPLMQAVMRCLEKDPAQRFSTIAEFADAIRPFAPISTTATFDRGSRASLVNAQDLGSDQAVQASSQLKPGAKTMNAWGNTQNEPRDVIPVNRIGARLWLLLGGTLVAAAAVVSLFLLWRRPPVESRTTTDASTPPANTTLAVSSRAKVDAASAPLDAKPEPPSAPPVISPVQVPQSATSTAKSSTAAAKGAPTRTTTPSIREALVSHQPLPSKTAPSTKPQTKAATKTNDSKDLFGDRN